MCVHHFTLVNISLTEGIKMGEELGSGKGMVACLFGPSNERKHTLKECYAMHDLIQ